MQQPTCVGMRVRTTQDAQAIFHAVHLQLLPMITRRLDNEERREIRSGCVYVWEERSPNAESIGGVGIERWTDSRSWGPSRVRDEFLYYHERDRSPVELEMASDSDTTYADSTVHADGTHEPRPITTPRPKKEPYQTDVFGSGTHTNTRPEEMASYGILYE
ncbi:hypothetical protein D9756_007641 [Leucocoprinus leucothites]|uniref:Gti1/Pac2 family-domain-containing protein n=1 Tax=Leucocoprinus leucothites TaxID=201217 RepID=A0A8H5D392_9AGAR|nr:hypothetical protein D9756_007641 [Leucoagaricus leucothites]